jgi:mRNA-degrading endonuclease RelE of RelBE toxin-antitoxin system
MFEIRLSEDAERHLNGFSARDRRLLVQAIEEQLTHQPTIPTRNRKQLRENPLAIWELRVQEFRVLYNVDESVVTVFVVAIAVKEATNSSSKEKSIRYEYDRDRNRNAPRGGVAAKGRQ